MIEIYSKGGCKYCTLAKEFLDQKGIEYAEHKLDPLGANYQIERQKLIKRTHQTTFPWIFVGTHFLGGYTDLIRAHDTLLLEKLGVKLELDF